MSKIAGCLFLILAALPVLAQPDVSAWEVLNKGLHDPKNYERRRQAVTAIGSIGLTPEALRLIEHGLRDDDALVRQTAAAELEVMKATASIPALKAALDDPSGEVVFTAAKALWALGDRTGEAILQDVMTGQLKATSGVVDGALRDAKRTMRDPKAIARLGGKEASGALLGPFSIGVTAAEEFMKDSGAPGRMLSATLLAQHCEARNQQLLEWDLREEKSVSVRAAVAKALGACGNPDDIVQLEPHLADSHDALRFMAAASIIRLTAIQQARPAAR